MMIKTETIWPLYKLMEREQIPLDRTNNNRIIVVGFVITIFANKNRIYQRNCEKHASFHN